MSTEDNKAIVGHWFTEFWGPDFDPAVIDELAAPDIRFEYSLHAPVKGGEGVLEFATKFRAAFPDLASGGTADLIAEGEQVIGQWIRGGTHTGEPMTDLPLGGLPEANTGKTMRFTGTTVLKVVDGPGSRLSFVRTATGGYEIHPQAASIQDLKGTVPRRVGPVTLADMDEAIAAGATTPDP